MSRKVSNNSNGIGCKIKELRNKKGLSQAKLANLIGCAQNTVAEWEKREGRAPGKKLLARVAQVLEVSLDQLLGIEKVEKPQLPCYGEVYGREFTWSTRCQYNIEVPPSECISGRFAIKILDDLLEPIVYKDDYCIFDKLIPKDGDIVVIRLPENDNKAAIRRWRQQDNHIVLLETNPRKICSPYFLNLAQTIGDNFAYFINGSQMSLIVEGRLVAVKRIAKLTSDIPKINYIFS